MPNDAALWLTADPASPFRRLSDRLAREEMRKRRTERRRAAELLAERKAEFASTPATVIQLENAEFWQKSNGDVIEIASMDPVHAANALRLLSRGYRELASDFGRWQLGRRMGMVIEGTGGTRQYVSASEGSAWSESNDLAILASSDPETWFTTRPQVKALLERSQAND
jgi:hypothetical protein